MAELKIQQSEKYQGNDWWEWSVWLEGSDKALQQIDHVEWTLHPTFRNPIRTVTNRKQKFRIDTGGWGVFKIHARVQTKDGSTFPLKHNLSLHYPSGKEASAIREGTDTTDDNYKGVARRAARLSLATGPVETFKDLKDLSDTLPSDAAMKSRVPGIKNSADSQRVNEEQRNIRVRAFLYAARRESNNDFNLVVGRAPNSRPEIYMIMNISGLPPANSYSFPPLKAARDAFKDFFGADLAGQSYDFYEPPISVEVEGSLFFNWSHASGQKPGPRSLRGLLISCWEVHPITKIVFDP